MGYASTIPFQIFKYNFNNVSNDTITLSTVPLDQLIATITTPHWTYTPTYAFMDLVSYTRRNSNVAANQYSNASAGDLSLTVDNVVFQTCGVWKDGEFITNASDYAYGEYRVKGTTNLASYIKPDTAYDVNVRNLLSTVNNLILSNLSLELNLIFNV